MVNGVFSGMNERVNDYRSAKEGRSGEEEKARPLRCCASSFLSLGAEESRMFVQESSGPTEKATGILGTTLLILLTFDWLYHAN